MVIDATMPVSITIVAQGFATLETMTATPTCPVSAGTPVRARATVRNTGASDTIWAEIYANGTMIWSEAKVLANNESYVFQSNAFTVTQNTTFGCTCGHILAGQPPVVDHVYTSQPTYSCTVTISLPEGIFVGTPTYNPGQQVEPGTEVTITYQVQNVGGGGMLWGGLYDYATPIPNLIAGYWEQNITPGSPVQKTVTIIINEDLDAQLLVGHFE